MIDVNNRWFVSAVRRGGQSSSQLLAFARPGSTTGTTGIDSTQHVGLAASARCLKVFRMHVRIERDALLRLVLLDFRGCRVLRIRMTRDGRFPGVLVGRVAEVIIARRERQKLGGVRRRAAGWATRAQIFIDVLIAAEQMAAARRVELVKRWNRLRGSEFLLR